MRITLCGSAQFLDYFEYWNEALTSRGHAVYSLGFQRRMEDSIKKRVLDLVHLTKIDNSDTVVIINGDADYIGESTMSELIYACLKNKQVYITHEPKVQRNVGIGLHFATDARGLLNPSYLYSYPILVGSHMDQAYQDSPVPQVPSDLNQQAPVSIDPRPLLRKSPLVSESLSSPSHTRLWPDEPSRDR